MATITLVRPSDGQTITVDENSVLKNHYLGLGWTVKNNTPPPTSNEEQNPKETIAEGTRSGEYIYIGGQWITVDRLTQGLQDKLKVDNGQLSSVSTSYTPQNKQLFIDAGFKIVGDQAVYTAVESKAYKAKNSPISNPTTTPPATPTGSYVYGADKLNSKANNAAVNTLYQAYFGRNASAAELKNYGDQGGADATVKFLEDYLKQERIRWNYNEPVRTLAEITGATPPNEEAPTNNSDKIIYKQGNDLYIKSGGSFYKIPDQETLENLVFQQGYQDTRVALPQNATIGQIEDIGEETPTETDLSMYDVFINNDPFLTEQFQDPTIKENFSKMSPDLQMAYIQMMQSLGRTIEAGKVLNPNIEITPEKIQEFTNQATTELDPYYQEIINNNKLDLETSISRLKTDFETGVRNAEEPFKRNMAATSEAEAQAGLTYGSERGKRETSNIGEQQRLIDENALKVSRTAEDNYRQAERVLGSDVLSGISIPTLSNYSVNKQGFAESGLRNLYTPQGGLTGSLQKQRTVDISKRAGELEENYRTNRILNTSQLAPSVTSTSTSYSSTPNTTPGLNYSAGYITLPSGQKISKKDPSYEEYKKQYNL